MDICASLDLLRNQYLFLSLPGIHLDQSLGLLLPLGPQELWVGRGGFRGQGERELHLPHVLAVKGLLRPLAKLRGKVRNEVGVPVEDLFRPANLKAINF